MNWFQWAQFGTQLAAIFEAAQRRGLKTNKAETIKYYAARKYCEILQSKNPDIVQDAGFSSPIPEL